MSTYAARIQDGLIAALATPLGQSALAVIRTSGAGAIETLAAAFSRPKTLAEATGNSMIHGDLRIPGKEGPDAVVDDVMLGVFRAPRSYTGEDMVEIYCHGSVPGIERIFALLFELGFRQAMGGEFSLRAFLNGKMDLTRAEAVQEIVSARSRSAQVLALHRLGGAVERKIDGVKHALVKVLAMVSIQLDYPDDEIDDIQLPLDELRSLRSELKRLAATFEAGKTYRHGVRLALAGRTNAGKSSLFNALVREERAIVSDVHGTTRDYLEAPFSIKGIPVRLFDTAGLRESEERIEAEGIRRSGMVIESSALVFYLIDGTTQGRSTETNDRDTIGLDDLHSDDRRHVAELVAQSRPVVLVWTKTDDLACLPAPKFLRVEEADKVQTVGVEIPVVAVSSQNQDGIDRLLDTASALVLKGANVEDADVLIDSERQFSLLERSEESLERVIESVEAGAAMDLVALDLQDSIQALGEITGEVTSDDVLEAMFSGFCVGK